MKWRARWTGAKTNTANTADDGEQAVLEGCDGAGTVEWAWPERWGLKH